MSAWQAYIDKTLIGAGVASKVSAVHFSRPNCFHSTSGLIMFLLCRLPSSRSMDPLLQAGKITHSDPMLLTHTLMLFSQNFAISKSDIHEILKAFDDPR
jgi:hypothetical protein